ncbi:hypothetical protein ACLX1H_002158 [Fusarium chlamydosporum]
MSDADSDGQAQNDRRERRRVKRQRRRERREKRRLRREAEPDYSTIPLTNAEVERLKDVVDERQPNDPTFSPSHLTFIEKLVLASFVRQSARETGIFEGWNSNPAAGPEPVEGGPSSTLTSIKAGVLKVNAPLTREQIDKSIEVRKDCRLAGANAFCGVTINYYIDEVAFYLKDSRNAGVSFNIVQWANSWTWHDVQYHAINNYDHHELERVRTHNSAVIVSCARRVIKKWAQRGTEFDGDVDMEDRPKGLIKAVLAAPCVLSQAQGLANVGDRLAADKGGSSAPASFSR